MILQNPYITIKIECLESKTDSILKVSLLPEEEVK